MTPEAISAIIEIVRLAGQLVKEARRTRTWTAREEQSVREAWERAFAEPHWQSRVKRQ